MKKTFASLLLCLSILFAGAQDGVIWRVTHNKKELLKTDKEDPGKNIVTVRIGDLRVNSNFNITYSEMNTVSRGKWVRTIALFTENDKELLRKDVSSVKIRDMQLKKMLQENKTIKVYTWALPKDPEQAARVRIRRVHLCTFELI